MCCDTAVRSVYDIPHDQAVKVDVVVGERLFRVSAVINTNDANILSQSPRHHLSTYVVAESLYQAVGKAAGELPEGFRIVEVAEFSKAVIL